MRPSLRRSSLLALLLVCGAAAPALAQRDVGPVRVGLFGGVRVSAPAATVLGLGGELDLEEVWTIAAVASLTDVRAGNRSRFELDARRRLGEPGGLRPYVGAGAVFTREPSPVAADPTRTRFGGLALAGVEGSLLGASAFAEVVGVQTDAFVVEVRAGVRLLVFGP